MSDWNVDFGPRNTQNPQGNMARQRGGNLTKRKYEVWTHTVWSYKPEWGDHTAIQAVNLKIAETGIDGPILEDDDFLSWEAQESERQMPDGTTRVQWHLQASFLYMMTGGDAVRMNESGLWVSHIELYQESVGEHHKETVMARKKAVVTTEDRVKMEKSIDMLVDEKFRLYPTPKPVTKKQTPKE